jgi:ABC-type branched-subunit amino acid transport system permease subunit
METFLLYVLLGIGTGAVYTILTHGLITIYKGSGVLNFAQAAAAMVSGYAYAALRNGQVPTVAAIVITVLGAAILGFLFSYVVMRPLRNAPVLARVVATLGLFGALNAIVLILWPNLDNSFVASLFSTKPVYLLGGLVGRNLFWLAGISIAITAALWALYKYTTFGLATRAAAENERGAALVGFSPDLIAASNWALGSALAAVGGILLAPLTGIAPSVSLLIVPVLAAALLGRFSSFWIATAAAFGIGALQSVVGHYWSSQPGVQDGIPFLVVMVAMVITGRLIPARGTLTVGRPPLAPPSRIWGPRLVFVVGVPILLLAVLNATYQSGIATSLIMGTIALSLVVVTGYVGQISLAQVTFAGVGAFAVSKFAHNMGIPFPWPILLGALIAVPAGVIIGLPALRVRGINLAVVTLGAAVTVNSMVFANPAWTGGYSGDTVPTPKIAGFSLDSVSHPVRFGIFCLVILLLTLAVVVNLRRSSSGRRMLAVRGNERAAAAVGINVSATKLHAFALSGFLAALGGGALAYQLGNVTFQQFDPTQSIVLLEIVYIGGIAAVGGGLIGGLITSGGLIYVVFANVGAIGNWWAVASGAIVILNVIYAPDGGVVAMGRQWADVRKRLRRMPQRASVAPVRSAGPEALRGSEGVSSRAAIDGSYMEPEVLANTRRA